jgi:aminopeptidase N
MRNVIVFIIGVISCMSVTSVRAQEITRDRWRNSEWQMKLQRWQNEKDSRNQSMILDQADFDSKYWELHFDVTNIAGEILTGKAVMTSQSNIDGLSSIDYDFTTGMTVDSVVMNGARVTSTRPANILRITLNRPYNTGELFTTTVYYHGHPDPSGFGSFTWNTHNGQPIVSTLSEPEGARDWWPCKDQPHDKADSADIYITCNSSYTGVSNGILVSNTDNGNGTRTYRWHVSYTITTYLICIAVSNYQSFTNWYVGISGDSMPVTNYVYPELYSEAVEDLNIVPGALGIYASMFGEYPFMREKFGYSLFPWSGGMEHQDNVFFGYMLISGNHNYDWITVHEMSHQWFGDAITCDDWPNVWMNEGFASYCEALYYERLYGFNYYVNYELSNNAVYDPSGPIYNPSDLFSGNTVYNKGSWVLHMLRGVMGDTAFFQGMRSYATNPACQYGTITTRDFQHMMEPFYGDSLGWFFDEWLWGQNRPIYRYSWTKTNLGDGRYEVFLHLRQTQGSPAPNVFKMPIKIYPRINSVDTVITVWNDERIDDFRFIVNGNPASLDFDKVPWILRDAASETYTMNIVTSSLPGGNVGVAYSSLIESRGGTLPYHYNIQSGHLPAGLTLTSASGLISGTPTTVEVDTFTVRCTDSSNPIKTDDQILVLSIGPASSMEIITLSLPDGRQDSAYSETIEVTGGLAPLHFSLADGALPNGILLGDSNGTLSGVATAAGSYTFTIHCQDSSLPPLFDEQQFTVIIVLQQGCFYIPGDINGNGTSNGIDITYGVTYLKGGNPPPTVCSSCPEAQPFYASADVNGTCSFNGIDITYFVSYLKGGPALVACPDCQPAGFMNSPVPANEPTKRTKSDVK